ncbi:hypothetical protein BO78DRAFT_455453 [Aspergillus sclerotiicarbonarius CBS 121057]|uniref:DUF7136 domain-containing protein n=1 Tax=Aspergillus sclerotiicarbonarius (strain CBS 121057 / IBT 28362) TaxID=1448318 RepID=A0A319E5M7_ASPSB|nr:hypothetical protein BO78DRAFT_455453 [Aspergillus sclerotiicarbonarius CBS 121057]
MYFPQARWLGLLGAILTTVDAVEVDLVFPRNESYSPADWFPIVFAVQNPQSAELLNLYISYDIRKSNDINDQITLTQDLRWVNWSGSADPYLAYQYVRNRITTGPWFEALAYKYGGGVFNHHSSGLQFFTIDDIPPKEVDLVAATANATCPGDRNAIAIDVTNITMQSPPEVNTAGRDTCVVTGNSTASTTRPSLDPCRVAIDEDSAASMASAHHTQLCDGLNPPDDCPKEENAAQQSAVLGISCFLAALGVAGVALL